jgi:hypothetical protein
MAVLDDKCPVTLVSAAGAGVSGALVFDPAWAASAVWAGHYYRVKPWQNVQVTMSKPTTRNLSDSLRRGV